ncbi:MAG: carbon-nitrogen hydrolase family protein [Pseudomonadota bacterium]
MKAALLQLNGTDDPGSNLIASQALFDQAVSAGAEFILTPEVTNCVSMDRTHQSRVLTTEQQDATLAALRARAAQGSVWLLIGSLAVKTDDPDGRFANRSFLIDPTGDLVARYDKIHMFDVDVSDSESYRESAGYRPGERAIFHKMPGFTLGMTICYDLRFPHLFRDLAHSGAEVITVPSAFSTVTGAAHWETLLRARAIETGAYILAPAQTGHHQKAQGYGRETYGHSLAIDPWGNILTDAGSPPGVSLIDINIGAVAEARARIPAWQVSKSFGVPE